jgi:hypothetical protein
MCNILVEHNTVQNSAVFNLTTWDLLNSCVTLDIDFLLATTDVECYSSYSFESEIAHQF